MSAKNSCDGHRHTGFNWVRSGVVLLAGGLFPGLLFLFFGLHSVSELVDSLRRDGADAQYMQYLSKSRITYHKYAKRLFKHSSFLIECLCDQQGSYS